MSDLVLWASATDLDPVRQGPVAALQITGAAREIVREIPPQHLRDGVQDPQQGHIPGLMLLARALTDRYGPLESEVATRAISELVTFTRMQGESVDALLVRFEVLRVRAQQRGGLGINAQGLSWMLLNALRLPPEMWDRLLLANQGILPQDEQQLAALCNRIRRTGHLLEGGYHRHPGQGATGDPGHFATAGNGFFPVFAASDQDHGASAYFGDDAPSAAAGPPSSGLDRVTGAAGGISYYEQQRDDRCNTCGMYFEDDEFSSATDTDDGVSDPEAAQIYHAFTDEASMAGELYHNYLVAKRRWRRFSGKPPRRYRRSFWDDQRRDRQAQRLQRSPYGRVYASFLPNSAFAGNKGAKGGKGKGKGGARNPRGKDGKVLLCSKCGSDQRLWRRCPQTTGGTAPATASPPALAMLAGVGSGSSALALTAAQSAFPGVTFNYMSQAAGSMRSGSSVAGGSAYDAELESLRSVSTVRKRAEGDSTYTPSKLARESFMQNPIIDDGDDAGTAADDEEEELIPDSASNVGAHPSSVNAASTAWNISQAARGSSSNQDQGERAEHARRVTLQLSELLGGASFGTGAQFFPSRTHGNYPWWDGASGPDQPQVFHARTRIDGRVGLLVDTGAHDNLVGSVTLDDLPKKVGAQAHQRNLDRVLPVSGVGKEEQRATHSGQIDCRFADAQGTLQVGSYTAPVIGGSALPALLGLRSLRSKSAIVDTATPALILPGPGGIEFKLSPGSKVHKLLLSDSGHLILPVHHVADDGAPTATTVGSLDFMMKCRHSKDNVTPKEKASSSSSSSKAGASSSERH